MTAAAKVTDLEQMMETLAQASKDPNAVSVGDFAKAVQSLQAELKMLESEVDRLGSAVGAAFDTDTGGAAAEIEADRPDQMAAAK
jgi:outer membrane murein-binding lipoprotein Lpp